MENILVVKKKKSSDASKFDKIYKYLDADEDEGLKYYECLSDSIYDELRRDDFLEVLVTARFSKMKELTDSVKRLAELAAAIEQTAFHKPLCPVYQNVTTTAVSDENAIKTNLIKQLTAPVKWTQSIQQMIADGATEFIEVGPGKVLQGLVKKINKEAVVASAEL